MPSPPVEWIVTDDPVPYAAAVAAMDEYAARIAAGHAPERVWLLQHPSLYTAGTSARGEDLLTSRFPVHRTGRGGQYTYHGPGQRIAYVMLDLQRRRPDVRAFVGALEAWIVEALASLAIPALTHADRVGVWVARPEKIPGLDGSVAEDKIAALGVRLRRWVSTHGIAVNVDPDLELFRGIVPCGIADRHLGVTSLLDLGHLVSMADVDVALRNAFERIFGPTVAAPASLMPAGGAPQESPEREHAAAPALLHSPEH